MSSVPFPIDTNKVRFVNTQNRTVPCEGPRCVPLLLDFTVAASYSIDLSNMQELKRLSEVQAIYVNNENGTSTVKCLNPQTGQIVHMAAGQAGYRNVLCPNPATLVFSSENQVTTTIHLLNFPVIDSTWSAQ